jgi:hypothetical protein
MKSRRNVPADPRYDPLLLYGPRPERKFSLPIQIVASSLIIAAFVLVVYLLSG